MPVNFYTHVCRLRLPMQLCIRHIEKIPSADNLFGRDTRQSDLCRVAANLRGPVAKKLLVGLDALAMGTCWRPLEILHSFDLDGCFV